MQTYTHPAYPPLTLTVTNASSISNTLYSRLDNEVLPTQITLTHISASYFLFYGRFFADEPRTDPEDTEVNTDGISKAEFKLGEDGQVKMLGVLLEPEMGDNKIWFTKKGTANENEYATIVNPEPMFQKMQEHDRLRGLDDKGAMPSLFSSRMGFNLAPFLA